MPEPISLDRLRLEPLDRKKHDRAAFTCGEKALDNYLKNTATRQQDQDITRVKVGCLDQADSVICFHAMNAHSLNITQLDEKYQNRFSRYESIPSAYLSMIAVDVNYHGCGIGSYMMADAMRQVLSAAELIGVHFLVLDALNEKAARLYLRLGFERLSSIPERMIISTEKIRRAVAAATPPVAA
jgi:GNAT superfamily N-acetyltransferase